MFYVQRPLFAIRWLVGVLAIMVSMSALTQDASQPEAGAGGATEIDAIWHVQSLPFLFRGRNIQYACAAFQKKLEAILLAVGTHPSLIIRTNCKPHVVTDRIETRVALATPVVATPENIAAATTFDSKRALLARVQKTPLPTPAAIEKFQAAYRTVVLEDGPDLHLDPIDCELLIAVKDQLFPKLGVVVDKSLLICTESLARPPMLEVRAMIRTDDPAALQEAAASDFAR